MHVNTVSRWRHVIVSSNRKLGRKKRKGLVEGMEGKLNGNYLKLIPGLCLEERMN